MSSTLLIQSYKDGPRPLWIERCLESVQQLCATRQWHYLFIGDELFKPLPRDFVFKVGNRGPILSDLGRLLACKEALHEYDQVIWLDADTLIFNPQAFTLPKGQFGFGQERWLQPASSKKGSPPNYTKWTIYRSACNALCYFERENPFLDFYIYTCQSIIRRVEPDRIAPQMIGPKLLTALHSIAQLPLTTSIGSASPHLIVDLSLDEGEALNKHRQDVLNGEPEAGLNLCHSLINTSTYRDEPMTENHLLTAVEQLIARGQV